MAGCKYTSIDEFKKCGEIVVIASKNTLAMTCNFCQQMFEQLLAFRRHLQLEHNDKFKFLQEDKKVEVYDVEELMNQSVASFTPDIDCQETDLAENDAEYDKEKDVNLYSKKRFDNEEKIDKLLQEIHNDWEDSDDDTESPNFSLRMSNSSNDSHEDIHMAQLEIEKNQIATNKQVHNSTNGLLQELGDFSEEDSLLANLKCSMTSKMETADGTNIDKEEKIKYKILNKEVKASVSFKNKFDNKIHNIHKATNSNGDLSINTKLARKFNQHKSKDIIAKELLQSITSDIESRIVKDFETRLRQLEETLEDFVTNSSKTSIEVPKCEEISEAFAETFCKQNIVNDFANDGHENSEKSLLENDRKSEIASAEDVSNETLLTEDLTKILVDALDDDENLLNIPLEEEVEDQLNKEILDILERELIGKENDQEPPTPNEKITSKENESCKQNNNAISKYQKTNLNVRSRMGEMKDNDTTKPIKLQLLEQNNAAKQHPIEKDTPKPMKANNEIYLSHQESTINKKSSNDILQEESSNKKNQQLCLSQQQLNGLNSYEKETKLVETNQKLSNTIRQRNSLNKEHQEYHVPALSEQKKKDDRLTAASDFINADRGNETPLQRCQIFLKPSPKTQEKQEVIIDVKPAAGEKTRLENKDNLKISTRRQETAIEEHHTVKTSEISTLFKENDLIAKPTQDEKSSPRTKEALNSYARNSLTTPQKLRNVAIKLQRITPDKLNHYVSKSQEQTYLQEKESGTVNDAKISKCNNLTLAAKNSTSEMNNIIKMPKKSTYCKQHFSEYSQMNSLQTQSNLITLRRRKASIDVLPSCPCFTNKKTKMSANITPRQSNLNYKSCAVNRSSRKKEVLQRMRNIKNQILKSIEEPQCESKVSEKNYPTEKHKKKPNILVENIQILPNLVLDKLKPLTFDVKKEFQNKATTAAKIVAPKNLADGQKQLKNSIASGKRNNDKEQLMEKLFKRKASLPLVYESKQAKDERKSSTKEQSGVVEKLSDLEPTQFDLSQSVVDFLQRDLKENNVNIESLLKQALSVDNCSSVPSTAKDANAKDAPKDESCSAILKQIKNEQTTSKNVIPDHQNTVEDFNESTDIQLLSKFGLKIIMLPDIEDTITLKERDQMSEKAFKFANNYRKWPRIWSTKSHEAHTRPEGMDASFKQLLKETQKSFKVDLNIVELKRLSNLINAWYARCYSNRLIEKRKISESTNRYLLMFYFIPKTTKRFYYCEYCLEYFNTDNKYFNHRIIHTGASYPFACKKCFKGFKSAKYLNNHESSCISKLTAEECVNEPAANNNRAKARYSMCIVCAQLFSTPELLYEHSKKHMKTIYNCSKCKLAFATAGDVQTHMPLCNAVVK